MQCSPKEQNEVSELGGSAQSVGKQAYVGICNLCHSQDKHQTPNCPFSQFLYHVTDLKNLKSILDNGLHPHKGRLGKAVYTSDEQIMCIKFAFKNRHRYQQPILLKLKVMLTNTLTIMDPKQLKNYSLQTLKKESIECVKCPYYTFRDKMLYEYALYRCQYMVVGYTPIKLPPIETKSLPVPEPQKVAQAMDVQNTENKKIQVSNLDQGKTKNAEEAKTEEDDEEQKDSSSSQKLRQKSTLQEKNQIRKNQLLKKTCKTIKKQKNKKVQCY